MNAQTRKRLSELLSTLEGVKDELDTLAADEREKFDNLNEGLQASDRGQALEQAAEELEQAAEGVQDAIGAIEEASGR